MSRAHAPPMRLRLEPVGVTRVVARTPAAAGPDPDAHEQPRAARPLTPGARRLTPFNVTGRYELPLHLPSESESTSESTSDRGATRMRTAADEGDATDHPTARQRQQPQQRRTQNERLDMSAYMPSGVVTGRRMSPASASPADSCADVSATDTTFPPTPRALMVADARTSNLTRHRTVALTEAPTHTTFATGEKGGSVAWQQVRGVSPAVNDSSHPSGSPSWFRRAPTRGRPGKRNAASRPSSASPTSDDDSSTRSRSRSRHRRSSSYSSSGSSLTSTPRSRRSSMTQSDTNMSSTSSCASGSGMSRTTHSAESNYTMALCEFRSRSLVGLCTMDPADRDLCLAQFGDNQTYTTTAMWVAHFMPKQILLPDKMRQLSSCPVGLAAWRCSVRRHSTRLHVGTEFPGLIDICGIRRRYFNESAGLASLRLVASESTLRLLSLGTDEYLCTSAANCLLRYLEFAGEMRFAPRTLRVRMMNLDGRVDVDLRARQNLELLPQMVPGDAASSEIQTEMHLLEVAPMDIRRGISGGIGSGVGVSGAILPSSSRPTRRRTSALSLFDLFPCRTAMGARSLRNSLLQPFNDRDTLDARLDMVQLFLDDEEVYYQVCEILPHLSDIDHIAAAMVQMPRQTTMRTTQKQIHLILSLGHSLERIEPLRRCVETLWQDAKEAEVRQRQATGNRRNEAQARSVEEEETTSDQFVDSPAIGEGGTTSDSVPTSPRFGIGPFSRSTVRLLESLLSNLSHARYSSLQSLISSVMDLPKSSQLHKSNVQYARYKFAFAVRSGRSGLLDVARRTFLEAVDELERERDRLSTHLQLAPEVLHLSYTAARGYHLSLPTVVYQDLDPRDRRKLLQPAHRGQRTICTTEQIISLDTRQAEAFQEIAMMAARAIEEVMNKIHERQADETRKDTRTRPTANENLDWLAQVSESLAWIDLTLTFADLVARSPQTWGTNREQEWRDAILHASADSCRNEEMVRSHDEVTGGLVAHRPAPSSPLIPVRPTYTSHGATCVLGGRHPLLHETRQDAVVPNDIRMSRDANFQVVTGANGSGKTTYLRMIGVVHILAHIGCFVPATSATIRLTDQILTLMSSVSPRSDASTFFHECHSLSFVLQSATGRALVLLDEVGRATSSLDGVGICWSSAEELLHRPECRTMLATHFVEMKQLAAIYPTVSTVHLRTTRASTTGLRYLYKVASGPAHHVDDAYGIEVAQMAGMPNPLLADARRMRQEMQEASPAHTSRPPSTLGVDATTRIDHTTMQVDRSSPPSHTPVTGEFGDETAREKWLAWKRAFLGACPAMPPPVARSEWSGTCCTPRSGSAREAQQEGPDEAESPLAPTDTTKE